MNEAMGPEANPRGRRSVFAWVFELTPEGLKRDAGIDLAVPTSGRVNKHLDRAIMVVLALALGYFAFDKFVLDPARDLEMIGEATAQARGYMHGYPPSSPSMAIFKDGQVVDMIERYQIENHNADQVAARLTEAFQKYCMSNN